MLTKVHMHLSWVNSPVQIQKVNLIFRALNQQVAKVHQDRRTFQVGCLASLVLQAISHLETVLQVKDKVPPTFAPSRLKFYLKAEWQTKQHKQRNSNSNNNMHKLKQHKYKHNSNNNNNKSSYRISHFLQRMEAVAIRIFCVLSLHCLKNLMRVAWNWWSEILRKNWINAIDCSYTHNVRYIW